MQPRVELARTGAHPRAGGAQGEGGSTGSSLPSALPTPLPPAPSSTQLPDAAKHFLPADVLDAAESGERIPHPQQWAAAAQSRGDKEEEGEGEEEGAAAPSPAAAAAASPAPRRYAPREEGAARLPMTAQQSKAIRLILTENDWAGEGRGGAAGGARSRVKRWRLLSSRAYLCCLYCAAPRLRGHLVADGRSANGPGEGAGGAHGQGQRADQGLRAQVRLLGGWGKGGQRRTKRASGGTVGQIIPLSSLPPLCWTVQPRAKLDHGRAR